MSACETCGAAGSMDLSVGFHKAGRRNQGAMTPQWGPSEFSPSLGKVLCPKHFKLEFAQAAIRRQRRRHG